LESIKDPLLWFSALDKRVCDDSLDSLRDANLLWPSFSKRGDTIKLRELMISLEGNSSFLKGKKEDSADARHHMMDNTPPQLEP
jgi:hypothetical protein